MYLIACDRCGRVGFHPSRVGAESRAETHSATAGHGCSIESMEDV